jgi:hypothetical protein
MNRFPNVTAAAIAGMGLLAASTVLAGPDWAEEDDAGSTLPGAQIPIGTGPLQSISGELEGRGGDFSDMFIIGVADPANFTMQIHSAMFDAQLFIFHITHAGGAYGLLANERRSLTDNRPFLTRVATDGTGAILDLPGDYLIAISGFGHNPVSSTGLIFNITNPIEVSGADGPGGFNRQIGWQGVGGTGQYVVHLTGATFPSIPAPGAGTMVIAGLLFAARRRR